MEFCGKGIIIDQIVATDTGDVNVNKEAGDIDERISLEPLADDPSLVSESAVDIQTPAAAPLNRAAVSPRVRPCDVTKPDSTPRRPRPSLPLSTPLQSHLSSDQLVKLIHHWLSDVLIESVNQ